MVLKSLLQTDSPHVQFSSVPQSCPALCNPWTVAHQTSLFITNTQSLLKLMSIKSVMPSNHLNLCRPLLLPPSIFPRVQKHQFFGLLLISWLQSPFAVILEPRKIKSDTVSPSISHEVMGADAMIFIF